MKSLSTVAPKSLSATDASEAEGILLPSATSSALAYSLSSINSVLRGLPPPSYNFSACAFSSYWDVIALADSLDLPIVLRSLLHSAKGGGATPFAIATLAMLAKDNTEMANISLSLLALPIKEMDPWSQQTLKHMAPLALVELYDLYLRWYTALDRLVTDGKSYGNFSRLCRRGCMTFDENNGMFDNLVQGQLRKAKAALAKKPALILEKFCQPSLACAECDSRVKGAVTRALGQLIDRSDYTLTL